jgi:hypothetical protein
LDFNSYYSVAAVIISILLIHFLKQKTFIMVNERKEREAMTKEKGGANGVSYACATRIFA